MNAAVVEILRREASDDETIVGRTYRHRASGKVYVVTEVVGRHRHGGVVGAEDLRAGWNGRTLSAWWSH